MLYTYILYLIKAFQSYKKYIFNRRATQLAPHLSPFSLPDEKRDDKILSCHYPSDQTPLYNRHYSRSPSFAAGPAMERPKDHLSSPEQRLSSPTVVLKKKAAVTSDHTFLPLLTNFPSNSLTALAQSPSSAIRSSKNSTIFPSLRVSP